LSLARWLRSAEFERYAAVVWVSRKIGRSCALKTLTTLLILLFGMWLTLSACSRAESQPPVLGQSNASPSPTPKIEASPSPNPDSPIRSVDFENFTFPAKPIYPTGEKYFTLRNGKYAGRLQDGAIEPYPVSLVESVYGDVTGDGNEEAMLVLTENIRGTAIPYYVYVYAMERNKPKLIWSFETGDRAQGGLRQVFAENGELVVELYGKDKFVGGDLFAEDDSIRGACCPSVFTRSRYEWRDNRFRRKRQLEVLQNPVGSAPFLPLLERKGK
jgi:hypothetical protein